MTVPPFGQKFDHDHKRMFGGDRFVFKFPNGYGASVINHMFSYGYPNKYEVAVLHNGKLCYKTSLTSDVVGNLTSDEVQEMLDAIANLPQDGGHHG